MNTNKTLVEIGNLYNVSPVEIGYINRGEQHISQNYHYPIRTSGKDIQKLVVSQKLSGENSYRCTITEEIANCIIDDLINDYSLKSVDIAKKYHTTIDVVKDINRGKS